LNTEAKAMNFGWSNARPCGSHAYLLRPLLDVLKRRAPDPVRTRVIDIGCGNGAATDVVRSLGYNIIGVEPSRDGVAHARESFPNLRVEAASAYDDLQERFGDFDAVICLEVIEHLYSPALLAQNIRRLLRPGGFAVLSTPYHGYFKNLALSLAGKWDFHHHPLVEHGHIKFWSRATLERLVEDASLCPAEFYRLGRLPMLAKSMMLVAVKPN
jgi:2-polyprenyl-6-hydroxyphenyl methylase/3-demethylubiquinone-9 3-methyltransferase